MAEILFQVVKARRIRFRLKIWVMPAEGGQL